MFEAMIRKCILSCLLLSMLLMTACSRGQKTSVKNESSLHDTTPVSESVSTAFEQNVSNDGAQQMPRLPDLSNLLPVNNDVYSYLTNLAMNKGIFDNGMYTYLFEDNTEGAEGTASYQRDVHFIMTDKDGENLTIMEAVYKSWSSESTSFTIPRTMTGLYPAWYQEYEEDDLTVSISAMIDAQSYEDENAISVITEGSSIYGNAYNPAQDNLESLISDWIDWMLYVLHCNLLEPNGYSIDQLGFAQALQVVHRIQGYDSYDNQGVYNEPEQVDSEKTNLVEADTVEADTIDALPDVEENFLDVEIDGVEKIFYLGHSSESAGGYYWYNTYTLPNTNGEKISIMIDPEIEAGETRFHTSSRRGKGFEIYYSADGLQTRYASHGEWEITMDEISNNGKHMVGYFYTSAELVTGGRPVEIEGYFCLNYGETVPEAQAVYEERKGNYVSNIDDSLPTLSWEDEHVVECLVCKGTKKCTGCAGWGRIDTNNDGILDQTCYDCHGSGLCYLCHGRGYSTF